MVLKTESIEWVAFQNDTVASSSSGIERSDASSPKSIKLTNRSASLWSTGRSNSYIKDDTTSVATWMKKPINSDASWAPVAPPVTRLRDEHPVTIKKRPPKHPIDSISLTIDSSQNPVSSSSDSSSSSQQRTYSVSQTASSTKRGNSRSRSAAPPLINVSIKSKQETAVVPKIPSIESRNKIRNEQRSSFRRARSRTRNPGEAKVVQGPSSTVAVASRGRSISQSRSQRRQNQRSPSISHRSNCSSQSVISTRRSPITSPRNGIRRPDVYSSGNRRSRSRSTSRNPIPRPPRREIRNSIHGSNSVGGSVKQRQCPTGTNRSVSSTADYKSFRSTDINIGRNISFGRTQSTATTTTPCPTASPKRLPIMEKLFGDQVSAEAKQAYLPRANYSSANVSVTSAVSWQQPERIHSRILLTATVYHNTATNLWIATINTNQKGVAKNPATASRYLKAFSFSTEKEARESAIANAPPKMMKFDNHQHCFICQGKFAMFRRASHCRNCGVCVCNSCSTTWSAKAIPDTYNLKKESQVKICKSCNFLSSAFKKALIDGDYEEAIALYGSGNANLRTPFPQFTNKKEEIMYPIHCAIQGGNTDIVRWLMEDHFCPVKVIRAGGGKRSKKGITPDFPILTSKNRSVLTIAMESLHVNMLRYLVVEHGVSVYETKDLKVSLRALDAVLNVLPKTVMKAHRNDNFSHRWDDSVFDGDHTSVASSLGADATFTASEHGRNNRDETDVCIICYENLINCVITPCGHQICCLSCSKNLTVCPVCNNQGQFIKIFRP